MMKAITTLCLFILPVFAIGQGFELFLGEGINNNATPPIKIVQIPNEVAYLAIYRYNNKIGVEKVDQFGNIVWKKIHPLPIDLYLTSEYASTPNGFKLYFTNYHVDFNLNSQLLIYTFNYDGELESNTSYEFPNLISPVDINTLSDNSVICLSPNEGVGGMVLDKVAGNGDLIWSKTFPDTLQDHFAPSRLKCTPDGEILVIGKDFSQGYQNMLCKFDQLGNPLWQTAIPNNFGFHSYVKPFPSGDAYLIYGDNDSIPNGFGTMLAKVNFDGQLEWSQDFTPHANFIDERGIIPGEGNTFYLTTKLLGSASAKELGVMQLGADGNLIWEKRYGETKIHLENLIYKDSDGGLFIAASTRTLSGEAGSYLLKLDTVGNLNWSWQSIPSIGFSVREAIILLDGGYVLGGDSELAADLGYLFHLLKFGSNGISLINGQLVYDENESCTVDVGEPPLARWIIKATDNNHSTYTSTRSDGSFSLLNISDSLEIAALPPNSCWEACPEPVIAVVTSLPDTTTIELKVQAIKSCPLLKVDASIDFLRRCFTNSYTIQCENTGTIPAENVLLNVTLDSFISFQSANLPISSQNGNTLTFNIGNLGVSELFQFYINVELSCDATLGQEHCLFVIATIDNTCTNIDNSSAQTQECQPNIGAFDPNDKRAFSEGKLVERYITADSIIEYQIRFQNTGTDTAFTVNIIDQLSDLLDIESIQGGASSHSYRMELGRNNIVKFIFNDIMLPDSNVNEPASHGFVKFSIRHKPGLVPGDVIPNKAAIYFDFNEAVITNNLELEIESPPSATHSQPSAGQQVLVFPNPTSGHFWVEPVGLQGPWSASIHDVYGRTMKVLQSSMPKAKVEGLAKGFYFILVKQGGKLYTAKVVVE